MFYAGGGRDEFIQRLNRMSDEAWWRRALRKRMRSVEHHAIQRGAVQAWFIFDRF